MVNSVAICFTVHVSSEGAEASDRFSRSVQFMGVRRGLSDYGLVSIPNPYQPLDIHTVRKCRTCGAGFKFPRN